jgi:hypothetical protein
MAVKFEDILDAYSFTSFGNGGNSAYLDTETGEIYLQSDDGEIDDELPDDIEDDRYVMIPDKYDLDLGKHLVRKFACEHLPESYDAIDAIFRKRGAYSRFKDLLIQKDMLQKWYDYQNSAEEKALRDWCKLNKIDLAE